MRPTVLAGNWKMYKTVTESLEFIQALLPHLKEIKSEVLLAIPFTAIQKGVEIAQGSSLKVGAQNMNDATEGAFTGEIAGRMLKEVGASFVLLGHSERRHLFLEEDGWINKKVHRALADQLLPILCVGETLQEREGGMTEEVLERQLRLGLSGVTSLTNLRVAYEPVWAIGTGETATPEMANRAHAFIREWVKNNYTAKEGEDLVILYGGSVKPANSQDLLCQEDIDGLLIGGASLSLESFVEIIQNSEKIKDSSI